MKRLGWLILIIIFLPGPVFAKLEKWEVCKKNAEQLVQEGKFEQAIHYLTIQSTNNDLDSIGRVALTAYAIAYIFSYGEEKQALQVIIPVYTDMTKKYGLKSFQAFWTRDLLIHTYLRLKKLDKALSLANLHMQLASTKDSLAEAYTSLADVYREQKDFTLALQTYLKAEKLFKHLNGSGKYNSKLDTLYNNRAFTYNKMSNYPKALIDYQASLDMNSEKDSSYYRTLFNMSGTYRAIGEPEKAKGYLMEVSDYYLKAEGINSLDYIKIENEIAVLDHDYGRYNEALTRYKKILSYGERLGRDDMTALALKNMGSAYNKLGNEKLAQAHLEKALIMYQKLPPSLALADNYEGLASLASEKNSFQEELRYYDKSLAIREALHQQNDADYAQVLTNKAMAYQKHQRYQEADDTYQKAFTILDKVEPKGQKMGFLFISRAGLWFEQKNYAMAETMLLQAIEMLKETLGENHPDVAYAYNNLAMVYSVTNQKAKSVDYYRKAVAVSKATEGLNHASTKLYGQNLFWMALEKSMGR